jgi:Domain of Unknown Function (DUF349)
MSLFSRLFRRAPLLPSTPEKPAEKADTVLPQQSAPDHALLTAREEEALRAAISGRDAQAIARLVLEGSSTQIRQLAAEAVEDAAQLRELIKQARGGKDKSVYKILSRKREAQLAHERQIEQLRAEISAVSAAIERHGHRPYDPLFTPTLERLEFRWNAVAAGAEPDVARDVHVAIDRAREVIAVHLRKIAAQTSREQAVANAAAEAQRVREQEEQAAAMSAAEQARILESERKAHAEKQETHALAVRQIGGLIRKAHGALNDGSTGRAAGLRRAIEEKVPAAAPLPGHLAGKLQQLDAKLEELRDWKSFSVAPKRVELLQEMDSLAAGSTLHATALAERIKSLQDEWRTLSKGAGENLEADWQRFQEAAHKAYQPCREYFEAQAQVRRDHLQRREGLLERLAAFEAAHNWQQPEWRTVSAALREARQEWRQHSPVDHAAGKAVEERFAAVMASLQSRLDVEYARNIKEKKMLIDRAQRLLDSEDSRKAIDEVKELQQKWKILGPVPRDADRSLWEEFRKHCDALFKKREQLFTEHTTRLEANRSKAILACEEVERIAGLSGSELLESARKLSELRLAFEGVGEFPQGAGRELHRRFERAVEHCDKAVAEQRARDAERSWSNLFEAANMVRAYRLSIARNAQVVERDALRQAAEDHVAGIAQWPKGGLAVIRSELAREDANDLAANEAALRQLCIRAEVFADRPTPPEDQPLRREYQVQRLVRGMGQGATADEAQLDTLAIEWVGVGPTEDGTYRQLLERFRQCREHWLTRSLRPSRASV